MLEGGVLHSACPLRDVLDCPMLRCLHVKGHRVRKSAKVSWRRAMARLADRLEEVVFDDNHMSPSLLKYAL